MQRSSLLFSRVSTRASCKRTQEELKKVQGMSRKHHLPSGFGTVRYIGPHRTNPYAVHPPTKEGDKRPKAICYVPDFISGLKALALYHAGLFTKERVEALFGTHEKAHTQAKECDGAIFRYCKKVMEDLDRLKNETEENMKVEDTKEGDAFVQGKLFSVSNSCVVPVHTETAKDRRAQKDKEAQEEKQRSKNEQTPEENGITVKEVFDRYMAHRFGSSYRKKLSHASWNAAQSAFLHLAELQNFTLDELSVDGLQACVNAASEKGLSKTTVSRVVMLIKQLYRYALVRELCTKNVGQYVEMPAAKEETHHPDFSDAELTTLWTHASDPVIRMVLVMCYSGFRIGEYKAVNFEIHLEEEIPFFKGGLKTDAGRDRIVPIHSAILPLVKEMNGEMLCGKSVSHFRKLMKEKMQELQIDGGGQEQLHTPHSCRHTFSRLCESYEVREADRKRLLGHSFGNDVTNRVYGHRRLQELKTEIEKIRVDRN